MYRIDLREVLYVGAAIPCVLFLVFIGIDFLFIDEKIKSKEPITPEIRLILKNNEVDTLYIYKDEAIF